MKFETIGEKTNPAVLFFHAMGVTGASILAEAGGNRTGTCGGIFDWRGSCDGISGKDQDSCEACVF